MMSPLLLQVGSSTIAYSLGGWGVAFALGQLLVNIFCAVGVANATQQREAQSRSLVLVPRWVWIVGTFFSGLVGVLIYWAVHESTLSRES
ncbi:MAG: hypothetical protein COA70_08015 [Planctomycetota bacterium]|nr:MAG: hypothetical protein COA70_08015 [Planctomycetota bacterium]